MESYYHKHLLCGGTFDHLHPGHKHFLQTAFLLAKQVSIGLTNYSFYQKPYAGSMQTYSQRYKSIKNYLQKNGLLNRVNIIPIYNAFGPSINNYNYDSILISDHTLLGAQKINFIRQKKGLKKLKIKKCSLLSNFSSRQIRQGNFIKVAKKNLILPKKNRHFFKKPLGQLFFSPSSLDWPALKAKDLINKFNPPFTAVIGDVAVHSFVKNKLGFNLAIVDQKTQREPFLTSLHRQNKKRAKKVIKAVNQPGTISAELITKSQVLTQVKTNNLLEIKGEEDLAVLPIILFSPLNSLIFYGQPQKGLVVIKVSLEKKQETLGLLKHFI